MSPVPGSRPVALLLGTALLLAFFAAPALAQDGTEPDFSVPADAPAPAEGKIVRVLTIGVVEPPADGAAVTCADGQAAPCWDVSTLSANPGDVVVLVANLVNSAGTHNLHLTTADPAEPGSDGPKTGISGNGFHKVALVMPEEGALRFICDAHPTTMVGSIVTPAEAAAAGGAHASVPALGVHFLAYWVGVIAFAILFLVYGMTFFLFKYNETRATTDHWDRSEPAGESKRLAAVAPLLAVVIAIAAIAAIVFVATR